MAQRKESKTTIRFRDLKPTKDANDGVIVDVNSQTHQQSHSIQYRGTPGYSATGGFSATIRGAAGRLDPKCGFMFASQFLDRKTTAPQTRSGTPRRLFLPGTIFKNSVLL